MIGLTNVVDGVIGGRNLIYLTTVASASLLPATAIENTLTIVTTDTVTDWIWSAEIPTAPINGMVWIRARTSGTYRITLANTEKVQMFPCGCSQYIVTDGVGAWVPKPLYLYQNASWHLTRAEIIVNGNFVESNSWSVYGASVSYDSNYEAFAKKGTTSGNSYIDEAISVSPIDIRGGFSRIVFLMARSSNSGSVPQRQIYVSSQVITPAHRTPSTMRTLSSSLVGSLISADTAFNEYGIDLGNLLNKESVYIVWSCLENSSSYTYLRDVWLE